MTNKRPIQRIDYHWQASMMSFYTDTIKSYTHRYIFTNLCLTGRGEKKGGKYACIHLNNIANPVGFQHIYNHKLSSLSSHNLSGIYTKQWKISSVFCFRGRFYFDLCKENYLQG